MMSVWCVTAGQQYKLRGFSAMPYGADFKTIKEAAIKRKNMSLLLLLIRQ
jgi:hypothetical protein